MEALAVDRFEKVLVAGRAALEREDPWEALVEALWAGAELLAGDRAFTEIVGELRGPMPLSAAVMQETNDTWAELLRRAQASGDLRPDVVLDDIPMIMCGVGMATRKPHQCPDAWRRHLSILVDGLRASSASGSLPS